MLAAKASTVTEVTCDNATRSWHAEMTEIDTEVLRQGCSPVSVLVREILIQLGCRVLSVFNHSIMRHSECVERFHSVVYRCLSCQQVLSANGRSC
ncbi:Uncharacterised protein [Segatella copri]|nr:Uncharacterised protein [Segatella copri]